MAAKQVSSKKKRRKSRRSVWPLILGLAIPTLLVAVGAGVYFAWDNIAASVGLVDTPESLYERTIDLRSDHADLLATIKTAADVQAKAVKISDILHRRTDLRVAVAAMLRTNPEGMKRVTGDNQDPRMKQVMERLARETERISADAELRKAYSAVEWASWHGENDRYSKANYENLKAEAKRSPLPENTPLEVGTRIQFLHDGSMSWQNGTVVEVLADGQVRVRGGAVGEQVFLRSELRLPADHTPIAQTPSQAAADRKLAAGVQDDHRSMPSSASSRPDRPEQSKPIPSDNGNSASASETPHENSNSASADGNSLTEFARPGFLFGPGSFGPNGPPPNPGEAMTPAAMPTPGQANFVPPTGPPMPSATETITVVVVGTISREVWDSWCKQLQSIVRTSNAPVQSFSQQHGTETKATLFPAKDLQTFADKIDFAKVIAVDEETRVIQLQVK